MSSDLSNYIKKLYEPNLSDSEALEAERNFVEFFKILEKVNQRLEQEVEGERNNEIKTKI